MGSKCQSLEKYSGPVYYTNAVSHRASVRLPFLVVIARLGCWVSTGTNAVFGPSETSIGMSSWRFTCLCDRHGLRLLQ